MNKIAIIYHSEHHFNTKKLLDAIEKKYSVDLISVPVCHDVDLKKYTVVGFASGVYKAKLHQSIRDFVNEYMGLLTHKSSFIISTSGSGNPKYNKNLHEYLAANKVNVLASFHCRGYDTFGPFKLVGGTSKGHPTEEDIDRVVQFFEKTVLLQ